MKKNVPKLILLIVALLSTSFRSPQLKTNTQSLAYTWGQIALEATANDTERNKPRPTITSRYLGLIFTAMFDAWSRYDLKAKPMYLNNVAQQNQKTLKNKEIAISYAAYRTLNEYFYADSLVFKSYFIKMGFDPTNFSQDPNTPEGIGNLAAKAVIEARAKDGSNQTEKLNTYQPVNTPDNNISINRWQPKYFSDGKGRRFAPECLSPNWHLVKTMALDSASQFRSPPPPIFGSQKLNDELGELINLQANLSFEQKALVEFMRDGPKSVQQAGHWLSFAQWVSVRDHHDLDQDIKMYFLVEMTAMDSFIAAWDTKMFYDYARPYSLIHEKYKNQQIKGWAGTNKGFKTIKGEEWQPYSPETFLCPPFPAYISGHSCVSAACAQVLKDFTGSDTFGANFWVSAGKMTEPEKKSKKVLLSFPTFTETANLAGYSRVLGGYHIQSDNIEGLKLGRNVAAITWKKYIFHIGES